MKPSAGQGLVELALTLPLVLFILLGFTEVFSLQLQKGQQDRSTAVVADFAAQRPGESWEAIANRELPGCEVTVERDKDIVTAGATCHYSPVALRGFIFDGLPISSEESAVAKRTKDPEPPSGG